MDKAIIEELKTFEFTDLFKTNLTRLNHILKKKQWHFKTILSDESLNDFLMKILGFILAFPIAFQGFIINFLPFRLSKYLRTKVIKDPQFTSSIKFVIGAILMPIFFLILFLISLIFNPFCWSLLVLVLLPLSSYFSYYYFKQLSIFTKKISYRFSKEKEEIDALKAALFQALDNKFTNFKGL